MHVLLIEDEVQLRETVATALLEDGFVVEQTGDGRDGLQLARMQDFDIIILDIMLPGMDGWSILRELRRSKDTPVICLTARDTVTDRVRGLDAGADDYLIKPFDLKELLARVRVMMRRISGAATSVIHLGDIAIDVSGHTVRMAGEHVNLTSREQALLELLAIRRGRVVSRSSICDQVFDGDDENPNLVEVYISKLRKRLGADLIRTRRGMGYLIDA